MKIEKSLIYTESYVAGLSSVGVRNIGRATVKLGNVSRRNLVLERRSLLEMYADFFAHPDELVSAAYENTPEKRFLAVLKYYLNSFFPARKSVVAKKPYNPILGETFRCRWTLPGVPLTTERTAGGPFPELKNRF